MATDSILKEKAAAVFLIIIKSPVAQWEKSLLKIEGLRVQASWQVCP